MPTVDELLRSAVGLTRESCEQLLGELIAVDDPMITTGQAERVLGLARGQVARLHRQGWLERNPAAQLRRYYRLADVLQLAQPISVETAAKLIGCPLYRVAIPPERALRRLDAIVQRGRRRRPPDVSWPFPDDSAVELSPVLVSDDEDRWVGLLEVAVILGRSPSTVQHMATAGQLDAEKHASGWRMRYSKVVLVRNALQARAAREALGSGAD
ncbi:MAG TPA: type IV toxin-antitoxin system AbiEi family antitoxin domain-containing protein [Kribbella sp.]